MDKTPARRLYEEAFKESEILRTLFRDLDQTMLAAGAGDGPTLDTCGELLQELKSHLEKHFEMEERGGYLAEAIEAAPHFAKTAEELNAQHAQFRMQLATLLELSRPSDEPRVAFPKLYDAFQALAATLRDHEAAENEIVQRAFEEDVAAAD